MNNYDSIFEYDIFIGESEYISKGLGTQIVNYVNDYIYNNYLCDCIVLRPFDRNKRAIRCYEKCGFKEYGRRRKCKFITFQIHSKR